MICAVVGLLIGVVIGIAYRKKIAEGKVGVAEERANKIVEDAVKDAEAKKKEILLEAKEESIKTKNELEREVRDRRNELHCLRNLSCALHTFFTSFDISH